MGYVVFAIALLATVTMYACCKTSGECARAEETAEMERIMKDG